MRIVGDVEAMITIQPKCSRRMPIIFALLIAPILLCLSADKCFSLKQFQAGIAAMCMWVI